MRFTEINGTCSTKYTDWIEAGKRYCKGRDRYHCLPNEFGQYGEICIPSSWIQSSFCPEYNTVAEKINVVLCDFHEGNCPVRVYSSNQAYKYSGCFNTRDEVITKSIRESTRMFTTNEPPTISIATEHEQPSSTTVTAVCVTIAIIVILAILFTTVIVLRRRKLRGRRSEEKDSITVPMLGIKKGNGNEKLGKAQLLKSDKEVHKHKEDITFYPCTRVIEECWKVLNHYGILIITGIPGSGKTKLGLEIISLSLNQYIHGKPSICRIRTRLEDCDKMYTTDTVTFALLDDCFEKLSYYKDDTDFSNDIGILERIMNNYIVSKRKMYMVVTMHTKTWEKLSPQFKANQLLSTCIAYDMASDKIAFNAEERRQILLKHIKANDLENTCEKQAEETSEIKSECIEIDVTDWEPNIDNDEQNIGAKTVDGDRENEYLYLYFRENKQTFRYRFKDAVINQMIHIKENTTGFPEICFLMCRDKYFMDKSEEFLKNPRRVLRNRILDWYNSTKGDKAKYKALAYTLLKGGQVSLDNIDSGYATLVESSPDEIRDTVSTVSGIYLKEMETGVFVFQNDVITLAAFSVVGFKHTETLICYCDADMLLRFIRTDKFKEAMNTSEMVFCVERNFNKPLVDRLKQMRGHDLFVENLKCMEDTNIFSKWKVLKSQKEVI